MNAFDEDSAHSSPGKLEGREGWLRLERQVPERSIHNLRRGIQCMNNYRTGKRRMWKTKSGRVMEEGKKERQTAI
jgi:hypothetical protein